MRAALFVSLWFGLAVALGAACSGRNTDTVENDPNAEGGFRLTADQRQLVVFGANWCKPCRKEIDDLNALVAAQGEQLLVKGFLVEDGPGEVPVPEDLKAFTSPSGASPSYPVELDPDWAIFEKMTDGQDRTLPLLLLVEKNGDVYRRFQGATDFEAALLPTLESWMAGEEQQPEPVEEEKEPEEGSDKLRLGIARWVSEIAPNMEPEVVSAIEAGWQTGLSKGGFTDSDMPFENGKITLQLKEAVWIPLSARWESFKDGQRCELTVWYEEDGSFKSYRALCQ